MKTATITYRTGTKQDLDAFYELYRTEHIESYGNFALTKEEVGAEMDFPNFDMSQHSQYAFNEEGMIVGYMELRVFRDIPVRPSGFAYVHPDYRGQGIGTYLSQWAIKQAEVFIPQVPDHARVVLQAYSNLQDGQKLLEDLGFIKVRESYLMSLALHDNMPKPKFPENLQLITMAEHPVLEDFIRIYQETFKDHRGSTEEPLSAAVARWEKILEAGDFPPENFYMLREGDEDAAILILANKSDENENQGFVQTLGVMPKYRRMGLGENLLYLAFEHFNKMGKERAGLSVDGASLTGAQNLYKKVGMDIDMVYNAYDLEIRAGVELSKQ